MSTTMLMVVCGGLVFAPFLFECVRFLIRGVRALMPRRRRHAPVPEFGPRFESSVQDALYGGEPRWQRLEVRPAGERDDSSAPGRIRRRRLRRLPYGMPPVRAIDREATADHETQAA